MYRPTSSSVDKILQCDCAHKLFQYVLGHDLFTFFGSLITDKLFPRFPKVPSSRGRERPGSCRHLIFSGRGRQFGKYFCGVSLFIFKSVLWCQMGTSQIRLMFWLDLINISVPWNQRTKVRGTVLLLSHGWFQSCALGIGTCFISIWLMGTKPKVWHYRMR